MKCEGEHDHWASHYPVRVVTPDVDIQLLHISVIEVCTCHATQIWYELIPWKIWISVNIPDVTTVIAGICRKNESPCSSSIINPVHIKCLGIGVYDANNDGLGVVCL